MSTQHLQATESNSRNNKKTMQQTNKFQCCLWCKPMTTLYLVLVQTRILLYLFLIREKPLGVGRWQIHQMRLPDLLRLAPLTDQIKSSLRASHLKFKGGFHNFGRGPARGTGGPRGAHWLIQRGRGVGDGGDIPTSNAFYPTLLVRGTSRPEKSWWPNLGTDWKISLTSHQSSNPQQWHGLQMGILTTSIIPTESG